MGHHGKAVSSAGADDGGGLLSRIARLAVGDLVARVVGFLAFVYLARVLGVDRYGSLEFALSLLLYVSLLADGGLELWGTRTMARRRDPASLVGRVLPVRLALTAVSVGILFFVLPVLPDFPGLDAILLVLGGGLFVQALNLKWVFLGREEMGVVAAASVLNQVLFAGLVVLLVHRPQSLVLVAVLKVAGDVAAALYYGAKYWARFGGSIPFGDGLGRWKSLLVEAFPLGASRALGLLSYNFDSLFLGFLRGATPVGWYNAAYKLILAVLALPLTFFSGLYPSLSRTHETEPERLRRLMSDSLDFSAGAAVPIAVGGTLLARPVMRLVFGEPYMPAVPALQILAWSAALVVLRGTFREALKASEFAWVDLRCAGAATGLNLVLNLALIPIFGIVGAASATVVSEILWFLLLLRAVRRDLVRVGLWGAIARPLLAGGVMAGLLLAGNAAAIHWAVTGGVASVAYAGTLWLSGWRLRLRG